MRSRAQIAPDSTPSIRNSYLIAISRGREAASCGAAKCGTKVLYAEKAERAARKHDGRNDVSRSRRRRLERVTILLDTLLHTGKKRGRVQTRCHGVHKPRDPVNGGAYCSKYKYAPLPTERSTIPVRWGAT